MAFERLNEIERQYMKVNRMLASQDLDGVAGTFVTDVREVNRGLQGIAIETILKQFGTWTYLLGIPVSLHPPIWADIEARLEKV